MKAIDVLRESKGQADLVEKAATLHDACTECKGRGGAPYYPECPCSECGFTAFDSFGIEGIPRKTNEEG